MSSSTIHLIIGVRVYIVYPPTEQNMTTLLKYLRILWRILRQITQTYVNALQHGFTFVQCTGETVTITPFFPTIVLATKTSAGVTIRSRCQNDVPSQLRHLGLMVNRIEAVQYVFQEIVDTSLEHHLAQLNNDLAIVLVASELTTSSRELTMALGAAWKENNSRFWTLIEVYISTPSEQQIHRRIARLWNLALKNQGLSQCSACLVDGEDLEMGFTVHFQKEHRNQSEEVR